VLRDPGETLFEVGDLGTEDTVDESVDWSVEDSPAKRRVEHYSVVDQQSPTVGARQAGQAGERDHSQDSISS
jgi:hypothetical protein